MANDTTELLLDAMQAADAIGQLDAMIKPMLAQREQLAAQLKALGPGRYTGDLWNATVIEATRTSVDWRAVAEHLKPSRQLLRAHTSQSLVTSLKVTGV